jgi:hypothetical protein
MKRKNEVELLSHVKSAALHSAIGTENSTLHKRMKKVDMRSHTKLLRSEMMWGWSGEATVQVELLRNQVIKTLV